MFEHITSDEILARIEASHEDVRAVYAYWLEKREGRQMPRRADIDPAELKRFLPFLMLVDVTSDSRRFVYRLVGTGEVDQRGRDPTGKSIREAFFGGSLGETLGCYDYVVRNRAPFCYRDPYLASDGEVVTDDIVYLPLSEDGLAVNMVLVFSHGYGHRRRWREGSVM